MTNLVDMALIRQNWMKDLKERVKILRTRRPFPEVQNPSSIIWPEDMPEVYIIAYRIPDSEMRLTNLYAIGKNYGIPESEIYNFFAKQDVSIVEGFTRSLYAPFEDIDKARLAIRGFYELIYSYRHHEFND